MEKQIAAVWADVLRIPNPGIHDHFFDSGGDSLAAVRLLAGLAEALGIERLQLGLIIEAPTIAELALLLDKPEAGRPSVLPLQATGRQTPLFWIDGYAARAVIEGIGPDRPVFMLSLPSPRSRDASQLINQYAGECFGRLRQFRPKGPYLLAGWCAAGVIALEVARRLQAQGEVVELILFDVREVLRRERTHLKSRWISGVRATEKLLYHLVRLNGLESAAALGYAAERMKTKVDRLRRDLLGQWREPSACGLNDEFLYSTAIRNYRAETYSGKIVHIWAQDRPRGPFRNLNDEWGWVCKGHMKLYEAAGNHITMFQGANGRALGRLLNHCLEELEVDISATLPNRSNEDAICVEEAGV
jgi:thioesterase domain-containing protein